MQTHIQKQQFKLSRKGEKGSVKSIKMHQIILGNTYIYLLSVPYYPQ